jgi:hypothetical protein
MSVLSAVLARRDHSVGVHDGGQNAVELSRFAKVSEHPRVGSSVCWFLTLY